MFIEFREDRMVVRLKLRDVVRRTSWRWINVQEEENICFNNGMGGIYTSS